MTMCQLIGMMFVRPYGQEIETAGKDGQLSHPGVASPRVVRYVFWGDQWRPSRIGGQKGGRLMAR